MTVYYPQARLYASLPDYSNPDNVIEVAMPVRRVSLERGDHNTADTCSVSVPWRDAGVDPRLLRNLTATLYMGDVPPGVDLGTTKPRFTGILVEASRAMANEGDVTIELKLHDYTALFLAQKPITAPMVPSYTDSLEDAWRKICDHVGVVGEDGHTVHSAVEVLRERIVLRGLAKEVEPGKQVASRFAKLSGTFDGFANSRDGNDAWSLWKSFVASYGLISFIEGDQVIVTDAHTHFSNEDAPILIYGQNVATLEERVAVNAFAPNSGIALVSFDALTGTTIEAFWPPAGAAPPARHPTAKLTKGRHKPRAGFKYAFHSYPGVTDPELLTRIARGAWEERSRQELNGTLTTAEMVVDSPSGPVDLLELRAGDGIKVVLDPTANEALTSLPSEPQRVAYLVDRGYSATTAAFLARQAAAVVSMSAVRHVKHVRAELETDEDGGKFEISIAFCNRIDPRGAP